MAVAVLTVYEQDDPPVKGGSATPLGTLTRLLSLSVRPVLSTKGFNAVDIKVNANDADAALLEVPGRWVTVAYPAIQTDPVMTVRLGPSHTVVLGESEDDEILHVGGLGILSLLERAPLPEEPNAPSPPASTQRGSSDVPARWHWLTQPFGAIMTRTIEEGQHLPGAPLGPITITFDRDEDSDGTPWVSMAIDRYFEASTGASGWNVYQRGSQAGDMFLVERFDFDVDAYTSFGSASWGIDRTSATYASGKVRVYAAPDDDDSNLLTGLEADGPDEPYTHVLVRGGNNTIVEVPDPAYTSGPGRWATIEYRDSDDPDMLERVGLEYLRRQQARTVARQLEIKPGDDPTNGRYLPWKHFDVGDLITLDAGGIDESARIVAFRVELVPGAHDATTEDAHRSLSVVLELNDVMSEDGDGLADGDGSTDPGLCCGPRPPTPTVPGTSGLTGWEEWTWESGNETAANPGPFDLGPVSDTWGSSGGTGTPTPGGGAEGGSGYRNMNHDGGSRDVAVTPGTTYRLGGYYWPFNDNVRIEAVWYDSGESILQTDLIAYNAAWPAAWTQWTKDLVAPTGAVAVQMRHRTGASGGVQATGWVDQVRIQVVSSTTGGMVGDGLPEIIGEPGNYIGTGGIPLVIRATAPGLDDDTEHGFPERTTWLYVDDVDNPTQVFGFYVLVDGTTGAAVWVQVGSGLGGDVGSGLDWFNVVDYGAVGDGSADDTDAIQDAIDAAEAAGAGARVYFPLPDSYYSVDTTLTVTAPLHFMGPGFGDGPGSAEIRMVTANTTLFSLNDDADRAVFEGLRLVGPGSNSSGAGIAATKTVNLVRTRIEKFHTNLSLGAGSFYSKVWHSALATADAYGIRAAAGANNLDIFGSRIHTCPTGLYLEGNEKVSIYGGSIENCSTYGIRIDSGASTAGTEAVTISGVYFENPSATDIRVGHAANTVHNVRVVGNRFNDSATYFIDAQYVDGLTIADNALHQGTGSRSKIRATSPAANVTIGYNAGSGSYGTMPTSTIYLDPAGLNARYIGGVEITGTPTAGQVPVATDSDSAAWGDASMTADDVRDAGRWELVMVPGITDPPEPVLTPDGSDWVYGWVSS